MNKRIEMIYNRENDIWGLPQVYKNIQLYPIKIKDSKYKKLFYEIFSYPKDSLSYANIEMTKKILKMSYLKFIVSSRNNEDSFNDFINLLKYITKENVVLETNILDQRIGLEVENIIYRLKVGNVYISEMAFNDIREIVLEQNGLSIEYVNQYNEELEKKLKYINDKNPINFEDQIFTLVVQLKTSLREIGELTLYQINNIIERLIVAKDYDIYKPPLVTGEIKLKHGDIKPWFYHREKQGGRYDSILIDVDKFVSEYKDILPGLERNKI